MEELIWLNNRIDLCLKSERDVDPSVSESSNLFSAYCDLGGSVVVVVVESVVDGGVAGVAAGVDVSAGGVVVVFSSVVFVVVSDLSQPATNAVVATNAPASQYLTIFLSLNP